MQQLDEVNTSGGINGGIFSGARHFRKNFLNFIFKNYSWKNRLVGCGKLVFTSPLAHI